MITRAIEILLVEDNPGDARLTLEAFKEGKVINNVTRRARRRGGHGLPATGRSRTARRDIRTSSCWISICRGKMGAKCWRRSNRTNICERFRVR